MKRAGRLVMVLVVTLGLTTALAAPTSATTWCSTNRFTGTVWHMKNWLSQCAQIPFDVVTYNAPSPLTAVTVQHFDAHGIRDTTVTPDVGGPICHWLGADTDEITNVRHYIVEACYGGGSLHIECAKYWSGLFYPYHCGPIEAFNKLHATGLLDWVKTHFTWSATRACLISAVVGTGKRLTTAVIVRDTSEKAFAGGPLGIAVGAGIGCVGGYIAYWWKTS